MPKIEENREQNPRLARSRKRIMRKLRRNVQEHGDKFCCIAQVDSGLSVEAMQQKLAMLRCNT